MMWRAIKSGFNANGIRINPTRYPYKIVTRHIIREAINYIFYSYGTYLPLMFHNKFYIFTVIKRIVPSRDLTQIIKM